MTITANPTARTQPASPIPRGTCLGRQNPNCRANQHGTYSAYRQGCRCPHAREDQRIYQKRTRENRLPARFTDATGTRRRLQALAAIGWRWTDMADRLAIDGGSHVTWQSVQNIASRERVSVITAARVRALYAQISEIPGPSRISKQRAAAKGWPPPICWDDDEIDNPAAQPSLGGDDADVIDEVAVRRALRGEQVHLTHAERDEAFRIGLADGMSATAIGRVFHLSGGGARAIANRVRENQPA